MRISFYLKEGDTEREITSFNELKHNPFKEGDIVNLQVGELYPAELKGCNQSFKTSLTNSNIELSKTFNHKKVKLISESKWLTFNVLSEPRLVIEYYCEILND
jgi:hypothetical protein